MKKIDYSWPDRKMLELAAKAAGYVVLSSVAGYADGTTHWWKGAAWGLQIKDVEWIWNPLVDDGDAFRLAVKLGLRVYPSEQIGNKGQASVNHFGTLWVHEDVSDDPYAATRRAIVRAAAEIGRTMK
jgi:hypothetical protein